MNGFRRVKVLNNCLPDCQLDILFEDPDPLNELLLQFANNDMKCSEKIAIALAYKTHIYPNLSIKQLCDSEKYILTFLYAIGITLHDIGKVISEIDIDEKESEKNILDKYFNSKADADSALFVEFVRRIRRDADQLVICLTYGERKKPVDHDADLFACRVLRTMNLTLHDLQYLFRPVDWDTLKQETRDLLRIFFEM